LERSLQKRSRWCTQLHRMCIGF